MTTVLCSPLPFPKLLHCNNQLHCNGYFSFVFLSHLNHIVMEDRQSSQVSQNPFAALFPSVEKAEEYSTTHTQSITVSLKDARNSDSKTGSGLDEVEKLNDEKDRMWMVNDLLQRVFLITVDEGNNLYICCQHQTPLQPLILGPFWIHSPTPPPPPCLPSSPAFPSLSANLPPFFHLSLVSFCFSSLPFSFSSSLPS